MTRPQRVLLVDDHQELLAMLRAGLEAFEGFEVQTADNGAAGLEAFMTFHPDCVVIDVKMPELNGIQLVRALRGDPATATTPLIILSALAQESNKLMGLLAGSDEYLVKPITPEELGARIHAVLALTPDQRAAASAALVDLPFPTD
jgi:two-component system, OmpR family, response regulator MprA